MAGSPQKEFHLQRTDEFYGITEPPTRAVVCQAGEVEAARHEKFLGEIREKAARLIEFGIKSHSPLYSAFCRDTLWHLHYGNPHPKRKILDDTLHRFLWVRDYLGCAVRRFEIELTLTECNVLDESRNPVFTFTDGKMERYPQSDFGETSLATWEEELHEKVLEMNPGWKGQAEQLGGRLMRDFHLEYQVSHLHDAGLVPIFTNSEKYLYSLLDEINRAVFNGTGNIKANAWEEDPRKGSTEGYTLYIPRNSWNTYSMGYLGIHENGNFEVRIVVKRDKSEYWDTDINGVVDTLQRAIIWWKEFGEYTEEERILHEEEAKIAPGEDTVF